MIDAKEIQRVTFLARFRSDQREECLLPLSKYLQLYPGIGEHIADEFVRHYEPEVSAPSSNAPGKQLGPYTLERILGRGGQGVVWLARHTRMDRQVALKVLALNPGMEALPARFEREVQTTASLEHSAFCPVYDAGISGGFAWLAMRYIEGQGLAKWAAQVRAEADNQRQAQRRIAKLFASIARALDHAHERGIVHRDVKPSNILVTNQTGEDQPVLLDLGVAHLTATEGLLTRTGDALGTPEYMAPETIQITSDGSHPPGPQADVWGLGVALYECLSGQRPFQAPARDGVLQAVLTKEPRALETFGIQADLALVVRTAHSKELEGRYSSAAALAEDLERTVSGQAVLARDLSRFQQLARWARRNPAFAATLSISLVALLFAAIVSFNLYRSARQVQVDQESLLTEVDRTSELLLANRLVDEVDSMWPITPELVPRLDAWLSSAKPLLARQNEYKNLQKRIRARTQDSVTGLDAGSENRPQPNTTSAARDRWLLSALVELQAAIAALETPNQTLTKRREQAANLLHHTVSEHAEDWQKVAEAVRQDSRFNSLELPPQIGLIPLGPDPTSDHQEFALATSGSTPARNPETGQLILENDTAVILILLPGGQVELGAHKTKSGDTGGSQRIDPHVSRFEVGLLERELKPFLVSKYELTQLQWLNHTGSNPSKYAPTPDARPRRPVEQVSLNDCLQTLPQMGLTVPSEAHWEYAARGGTDTIWYTGDNPASIEGHCNVHDQFNKQYMLERFGEAEGWWEDFNDGCLLTNVVGSYAPNPFGLHDVMGNVLELTTTGFYWFEDDEPRRDPDKFPTKATDSQKAANDPEPGQRLSGGAYVIRGGSCLHLAIHCRMAMRSGELPESRISELGVRPIRQLQLANE